MTKLKLVTVMLGMLLGTAAPVHAANCAQIGKQVAQSEGAQLVAANAANQNGRNVCRIVLLVDAGGGVRKRVTRTVPAG